MYHDMVYLCHMSYVCVTQCYMWYVCVTQWVDAQDMTDSWVDTQDTTPLHTCPITYSCWGDTHEYNMSRYIWCDLFVTCHIPSLDTMISLWSKETPPPRGGFLFTMFFDQKPCGARGKGRGFSPGAAARHSHLARVHTDSRQKHIFFAKISGGAC